MTITGKQYQINNVLEIMSCTQLKIFLTNNPPHSISFSETALKTRYGDSPFVPNGRRLLQKHAQHGSQVVLEGPESRPVVLIQAGAVREEVLHEPTASSDHLWLVHNEEDVVEEIENETEH